MQSSALRINKLSVDLFASAKHKELYKRHWVDIASYTTLQNDSYDNRNNQRALTWRTSGRKYLAIKKCTAIDSHLAINMANTSYTSTTFVCEDLSTPPILQQVYWKHI